jgi:hypothetical protein
MKYIEEYKINGRVYGIEDNQDGEVHYFTEGKKRYNTWVGGCGIGSFDELEDARRVLWTYARGDINRKLLNLEDDMSNLVADRHKLGDDPRYLIRFEV